MVKFFYKSWRTLPMWIHVLAMRMYRPKFRAAVAAMIFDEQGRVLLFKHTYRKCEWGIPAGGLEYGEQPEKAVVREFLEETGMQIKVEKLLLAESSKEDHNISLIFLCKIVSGTFKESSEISEMKYFDVNDLPHMLFAEKNLIHTVAKSLC
ncbi:MAG TPA: NUDIX domain-containing protein [Anaerolineales bacterium]|nr:NUDIX domain-containing protein [Anaerolineales bacterium]